jgi:hypothetical protein
MTAARILASPFGPNGQVMHFFGITGFISLLLQFFDNRHEGMDRNTHAVKSVLVRRVLPRIGENFPKNF